MDAYFTLKGTWDPLRFIVQSPAAPRTQTCIRSARWPRHATRPPPPNVAAHTIYAITSSSAMELTASTCVTPFVDLLRASTASAVLHMCHGSASPGSARTPCVDLRLAPRFRRLATRR
jgi:hypothetical protein